MIPSTRWLLVMVAGACCLPAQAAPAPAATPAPIARPQTTPVAAAPSAVAAPAGTGSVPPAIRVQLLPRRYTTLAAEVGAKIQRLPVTEGERFKQGQVVVIFDCSVQAAQMKRAEASYSAAISVYEANQRLAELNAVGKMEMRVSKAEMEKNQAEVVASAAIVSKCQITAPFSGRVAEQKAREQQFVQPGQALLEIIDDGQLEVEFIVPSKWMSWLKPGHGFKVRIDETGRSYPAKVKRVGARVDPVSQSVKILASIDGHFPDLVAGMSGRAAFSNSASAQ